MRVHQSGNNNVQKSDLSQSRGAERAQRSQERQTAATEKAQALRSNDSVKSDISAKGREFAQAKAVATHAPETREEKIAELRKRIAAGHYQVDAEKLAEKLVDEHLATHMHGLG